MTDFNSREQHLLLRSVCDTVVPKLVAEDIPLLSSLLSGVFPGSSIVTIQEEQLREEIIKLAREHKLVATDKFVEKTLQLFQIQRLHHGVMMVGPCGSGKSSACRLLLEAMSRVDGVKGDAYVVDPKAVTKDQLYGRLDSTTLEWTDGVFTHILRKILDSVRGESGRRHWIIFDGDVDPEWAENLNSVLDDNKLLTLPSGERLAIPSNVRIMFEVESLKNATLATVSRCGMVWFSDETVTVDMLCHYFLSKVQDEPLNSDSAPHDSEIFSQLNRFGSRAKLITSSETTKLLESVGKQSSKQALLHPNPSRTTQRAAVEILKPYFVSDGFMQKALNLAANHWHVMDFTKIRVIESMFALLNKGVSNVLDYNENHPDFPMSRDTMEKYLSKWLVFAILWGFGGSMNLAGRMSFAKKLHDITDIQLPSADGPSLLDYEVRMEEGDWMLWKKKVPQIEIETHKVVDADLVVSTVDTIRHTEVLCSWLSEHRPFLLCGPPGSGKTMTLMSTLRAMTDMEMCFLNFSSTTTPELILKTFDHYCEYKRTPNGVVLRPSIPNKWLVVFCDEINLPTADKYGTQRVITFLRQLTEQGGFWRPSDRSWVDLERIQFVGACNPPTDAGRYPLSDRFLRHAPLILVDFPGAESLKQIYGTFNRALLKLVPSLRGHADPLTEAMVEFYSRCQERFTADQQPHYIFSPRELTRWKYAMFEALKPLDTMTIDQFVRLFAHEGLRLFQDRLVTVEERKWCDDTIDEIAYKHFPSASPKALERPILFSNYLSKHYVSVTQEELRQHVLARLKVFYEEELNVPLVVFDSVLDHILRIDRVLRQPLGHLLLVGASGAGKTTLTRFVSWMNGLAVFQIKAGRNYSTTDFDEDLRSVMKRAGCKGEKICFIFDESNVLSASFLERMNALLASGEVPGLFDGDEYTALINQCKEAAQRDGVMVDTEEELYKRFIQLVQRNLHVAFTMNPANPDFHNRQASSPALFNRCVIDWFGDWSSDAMFQVGQEFTRYLDLVESAFVKSDNQGFSAAEASDARRDTVVSCLVHIHQSVVDTNAKLAKSAKKHNYITPRDFLDLIHHYVDLFAEKKRELEEQQLHLNVGLDKLKETEEQVKQLQRSLTEKEKELDAKNTQANEKLKLMVQEQNQAEHKREASIQLAQDLEKQNAQIRDRQEIVRRDLDRAEPALIEAQRSVKNIKKQHLDELRTMANPPPMVKIALEAVCVLISGSTKPVEWDEIRRILRKDDFIGGVVNFNTENLSEAVRMKVQKEYLEGGSWDLDKINRASKAAGPLASWVDSQVQYGDILDRVQPLRDEVKNLQVASKDLERRNDELNQIIAELEQRIAQYKKEYAELISEVQIIKSEMNRVQEKVGRSINLIHNLSSERVRWEHASQSFKQQISTMVGDVLLAAGFLTYIGFFDHFYRRNLMTSWKDHLEVIGIRYRQDLSLIEYLSKPTDRLLWTAHALPSDDLCIENAIILSRFNRYPLVIDPSGQATEYLVNHYGDRKLAKTSFADDAFMKNLESSLRFGCPLLVQDVEKIDPILNSVLNKEIHKTGGRVLIRVGDQDIDFSFNFTMFLTTRDPQAVFAPDLCSRVTFVNFTITPSSLQNQCLNLVLKSERPDVDKRRMDLLKLQGEYKVRLRELEESLLQALNDVRGNILDNDSVITTLETLKEQAAEVTREAAQTDAVMAEVESTSNMYLPFAQACSRVYFGMELLGSMHFLYQFSLQFFLDIVYDVLHHNPHLTSDQGATKDYAARLRIISSDLFTTVYQRVARSLFFEDRIVFGLRLLQIRLDTNAEPLLEGELDALLKGSAIALTSDVGSAFPGLLSGRLSNQQAKGLQELSLVPVFKEIVGHIAANEAEWIKFLDDPFAERSVPTAWSDPSSTPNQSTSALSIRRLLILKAFRPDRLLSGCMEMANSVLGNAFLELPELDLRAVVERQSKAKSPLLLCSAPGHDASGKVDELARLLNKQYIAVAMGSSEGYELAEKSINAASKSGSWVMLKNVHLSPQWLTELEKRLHRLTPHENFRLFLTMEISNPRIPSNLLRMSQVFLFEPPAGVKASLLRSYATVITDKSDRAPAERSRVHFLLAWFHAVVQERLRFTPLGWTKVYEFNEADERVTLDSIDQWVDGVAQGRANISPESIPWGALRTLMSQSLYGGRVDNEFDNRVLSSFVEQLFSPKCFDANFPLFPTVPGTDAGSVLTIPDVRMRSDFLSWIKNLPAIESPLWLGLPNNAEKLLKSQQALRVLTKWLQMQGGEEEELAYQATRESDTRSSWLIQLGKQVNAMLALLPAPLTPLQRTAQSIVNPLFRCLEREVAATSALLDRIRAELTALKDLCDGNIKSTNELRALARSLQTDSVPSSWKRYPVPADLAATAWLADFKRRLEQLRHVSQSQDYGRSGIWLGGLLYPEAYLTATRQAVAQSNQWSLEELHLQVDIGQSSVDDDQSFIILNLSMEGAIWQSDALKLTEQLNSDLPATRFKWIRSTLESRRAKKMVSVPVYLNSGRKELLFAVELPAVEGVPTATWYQRSLAIVAWTAL